MKAALEFRELSKTYTGAFGRKPFVALDRFSLTVNRGEIFGFLGPNGAGKTTAIHIALGLMFPTTGEGNLLGKPFGDARQRRRVGFLAESVSYFSRTAEDAVRFYARLNGISEDGLNQKISKALKDVDLQDVKDKNIGKFSRGMLQRVGLAQALVDDPELLILDEPTSALDPSARKMVREMLLRAREQGKTIFLSSHLLSEIELICDRVAIINRGKLARVGTVPELLESQDEFEIVARNVSGRMAGGVTNAEGTVIFKASAAEQRRIIEAIWSAGGEVVSMNRKRRSLEEVFLSMTSEGEKR